MGQEIRPGGIDILGDIPWGTHFCQFYQTKEDLLDILIPYFKARLENNEFCMWITAEPLKEQEAEEALRKAMPDFDRYLRSRQIEILPHNKWYLKDGVFNSERVLNGLVEKLNLAQSRGFTGLRVTGNTAWLGKSDWQSFTDYEAALNNIIGKYKIIAICSYCLERYDASELIDVVINHQFSVIRRRGEWKIIESGERRRSEQELHRLGEQYQIVLRTIMDGFWVVDTQGRFLEVNDAYCQLTGYSRQELLSMSVPDVEAIERPEETAAHIQKVIQNGADHFETSHRCKDGRIVHFEVNATYSSINGGRIYVFFQDVTEHRQADEELRQSEKRYRELFESMQEGFCLAELINDDAGNMIDFRFLEVNPAYEAIMGLSRDQVIGRTVNELFSGLERPWFEVVSRVVSTGEPAMVEGFVKPIGRYYQNHYYSPRPGQFASIFTDITEHKQAEEALRQARDELEIRVQKRTEELREANRALLAEIADRKRAEEAVKAERQRFNDALETLPAYLILLSPDYHVPFANRFFRERFGESHGKRCFEYLFGRTEPCEICETYKVLKTMKPLEWEWTGPDGHNYYVYDFPFTDTDGSNLVMEVGVDITQQKQAEKALRKAHDELEIRVQERTKQLQESEEKYRSIVETANEGILIIDLNDIITFTNQRMAELLGYTPEELLGRVAMDFMDADQKAAVLSARSDLVKGSGIQREFRFRRKDGSELWTSASASPLLDKRGHHFANLSMYTDISERKHAEERIRDALRESWQKQLEIEALLKGSRAILEYSKFDDAARSIYNFCKNLVGATGGYIALLSHNGAENEVLFLDSGGLPCTVDPSFPMPIRGLRGEAYRTGKAIYHNDFAHSEWLDSLPSGHVSMDSVLFAPLMIEGKVVGLLGLANKPGGFTENDARLATGFSELAAISLYNSRIWESLQESEVKYRILVEASPDGVLSLNAEGQIIDCNEGLCQLLGYEKAKVKGNDIRKFLPTIKPAELTAQLISKGWLEAEFEAVRQNGQTVTVWAKGVATIDEERNLAQAVLYVRDIAERKKLDELKDELIGLVSHEIRTPLTVIMGGLNTLLSEGARLSEEEKQQLLQDAAWETNSLSYLLGNLIELSRAQANRLALNLEPVAIKSITKSVVGKLEQQTTAHQFVIGLPPRLPMVQADPVRIERILHNLLENAVKYSPQGGEIRVFAKRDKNNLVIGVSDQGIGISQSDQIRLFKPFERLENREIEEIKGAGLGLMVCRRLVEAHGGRIWVESQQGLGSTFFFSLPLKKTAN